MALLDTCPSHPLSEWQLSGDDEHHAHVLRLGRAYALAVTGRGSASC
jgi:hypothetical protein